MRTALFLDTEDGDISCCHILPSSSGADLGFFVPQSKFVWRTGRYRRWAWSRLGVVDSRHERGGGEWALNNFYADSPPLDF